MKVIADLGVVPLGVGLSLSPYVAACEKVLAEAGLKVRLHAYGTNIEGGFEDVLAAVKRCREVLHEMGVPRNLSGCSGQLESDRRVCPDRVISASRRALKSSSTGPGNA